MEPSEADLVNLFNKLKIQTKFQTPNIIPFAGIQGHWVACRQYNGPSKTFGYYQCNYCQKTWMSAHSRKGFKQGCKQCDKYFYPTHLWKNDNVEYQKKKPLEKSQKPHMRELCQACKKGRCQM